MMTKRGIKILKVLAILNIFIALLILLFFKNSYLYAFEVGFFSSALVMGASLFAYRDMVVRRVKYHTVTLDDSKDIIDKLEDPYDLYSKEDIKEHREIDEIIKEERKKLKENRRTLYAMFKDTKAALSLYRLGAYVVLVLGFLYLNRHGLLHLPSYILALGIPIAVVLIVLLGEERGGEL